MKQIKELRKAIGVHQLTLAGKLCMQPSNYANIENGILVPKNIQVIKNKCIKILSPELDKLISKKETELSYLYELREGIK